MQIRLTDINTDKVLAALVANGFGLFRVENSMRGYTGTAPALETCAIWTETSEEGPCGYDVGLIRRELASFTRHEMVLETNRIPQDRLMALLGVIASENR